jgi:DNA repair protein RadD
MIELRPYQQEAFDSLMNWFEKNQSGNALVILPCGAGKSIVNAKIVEEALSYPNQRVMCLTHVRELITQNFTEFKALCPTIDAGIYCAGLGKKQLHHKVTFASIQSIRKKHIESGFVNLCIIDEAHLLSDSEAGGYRIYLRGLLSINPKMRIIGLTATEYRLKTGLLYRGEGAMFHDVAYDLKLQRLVQEGWLCRMIGKQAKTQGNTDNLHLQAGDFVIKEAESVFDEEKLVQAAVKEMIECGHDRKTWLIFCVSIKHAEHVARVLNENGIECRSVSEKTSKKDREQTISDLKNGKLRAATNVAVLTTGTNIPNIDMIVMLRPTLSPGLLLQCAGRGFRLSPETGKKDCLFLDMAGVLLQHGPLTHITAPPQGQRVTRDKKGKECPKCASVLSQHATECGDCGYVFPPQPRKIKHAEKAHTGEAMSDAPITANDIYEWYDVKSVSYSKHEKIGSPPSLKVTYKCRYNFSEWIAFESKSEFAIGKAMTWWVQRERFFLPGSIDDIIEFISTYGLKTPTRIKVKKDGKFPEIKGYDFERKTNVVAA